MALLDLQRSGRELGRIRIGTTVAFMKDGEQKKRPVKLDAFRFTTPSRANAHVVAEVFGGTARPWEERQGQWEVMSEATEIPIMIPPGKPVTQAYELWSGGGVQRRCDSQIQQNGQPCICPVDIVTRMEAAAKGNACKPMTRLSVILPDLIDLGVWMVTSGGYNAAQEMGATAEFLHRAAMADNYLPAILRLEQRSTVSGNQTKRYAVPVIEIGATLRELTDGSMVGSGMSLPAAPSGARAITGGRADPADTAVPPPSVVDGPNFDNPGDDDSNVVDAEIVTTADDIAPHVIECDTRADLTALASRAKAAGREGDVVSHPTTGARIVLRDLITARWRELPAES